MLVHSSELLSEADASYHVVSVVLHHIFWSIVTFASLWLTQKEYSNFYQEHITVCVRHYV